MTVEQLNPAFTVEAQFLGPVDGETRTTRFVLARHPKVAAWLLTVLDFILWKQGRLPDERRIGEPPVGETLQRLVAGAVILAGQRPDGGLALKLNPGLGIGLALRVRRRGQPAHTATVTLNEEPALCRWLLAHYLPGGPGATGPVGDEFRETLRRHALLVAELPAPEALFPDPAEPAELAAETATAARVIPQAPGAAVPEEVRALLGRHAPPLPPGAGIAWCVDAGTGLVLPAAWNGTDPLASGDSWAGERARQWTAQRDSARTNLAGQRYAVLREIVPPAARSRLRRYVRELVRRGYFPPPGDGQVELRSALHNEPAIASLHRGLAAVVSDISGETVQASYCYLGNYEAGAVLARHRDRPQCNYNLSLVLDMEGPDGEPEPWPIYLELDGRPVPVLLGVGDGLVYSGTELWHWRDALPAGQRAIVCFFHFVPPDFQGSLD